MERATVIEPATFSCALRVERLDHTAKAERMIGGRQDRHVHKLDRSYRADRRMDGPVARSVRPRHLLRTRAPKSHPAVVHRPAPKLGVPPNPTVAATVQQRAWTSLIWYTPAH